MNEAREAGIEKCYICKFSEKKSIIDYFRKDKKLESYLKNKKPSLLKGIEKNMISDDSLIEVVQEEPLGLGHAIWVCKRLHRWTICCNIA